MSDEQQYNSILSKQTSITVALAGALCVGAFWTGKVTQSLESKIDSNEKMQTLKDEDIKEWRKETVDIIRRLTSIAEGNKIRLERLEEK